MPGWGAQLPPDRVLSEMAALGFRATEAGPEGYLGWEPKAVVERLARHQLRLVAGFLPLVLHDPAMQATSLAAADRAGTFLEATGASHLISAAVVDLDWSPRIPLTEAGWRTLLDGFAQVDRIAAAHGLMHVAHPHWGTLVHTEADLLRVLDKSDVLFCLDTGHLLLGGVDPAWLAGAAGARVGHVHLKNVSAKVAERLRSGRLTLLEAVQSGLFRPLGEGDAPIEETVRELERGGYDGWYVLEQDCALPSADVLDGEGPVTDVRRSIQFLRSLAVADREPDVKEGVST